MVNDAFLSVVRDYDDAAENERKALAELRRSIDHDGSPHTISVRSQSLLALSELATIKARMIAYYAMCGDETETLLAIGHALSDYVDIMEDAMEIRITLPCLLPRRAHIKRDTGYFHELLKSAIAEHDVPLFNERVVIYFEQIFDVRTPIRKVCDCDNADVNSIINVISGWLLYDDGPERCSYMVSARRGEITRTIVHILKEKDFPAVLASIL